VRRISALYTASKKRWKALRIRVFEAALWGGVNEVGAWFRTETASLDRLTGNRPTKKAASMLPLPLKRGAKPQGDRRRHRVSRFGQKASFVTGPR